MPAVAPWLIPLRLFRALHRLVRSPGLAVSLRREQHDSGGSKPFRRGSAFLRFRPLDLVVQLCLGSISLTNCSENVIDAFSPSASGLSDGFGGFAFPSSASVVLFFASAATLDPPSSTKMQRGPLFGIGVDPQIYRNPPSEFQRLCKEVKSAARAREKFEPLLQRFGLDVEARRDKLSQLRKELEKIEAESPEALAERRAEAARREEEYRLRRVRAREEEAAAKLKAEEEAAAAAAAAPLGGFSMVLRPRGPKGLQ
jgi:hypothetical protein